MVVWLWCRRKYSWNGHGRLEEFLDVFQTVDKTQREHHGGSADRSDGLLREAWHLEQTGDSRLPPMCCDPTYWRAIREGHLSTKVCLFPREEESSACRGTAIG